jgi:lipid-A-disaccharide synthase-like uncharacterized protein
LFDPTQIVLCSVPFPGHNLQISLWTLLGFVGNLMFTSRVMSQWYASEKAGQIVIPVSFWWMSFIATLIMMVYAIGLHKLPLVLNSAVTIVPYIRNLAIFYRPNRPPRNTVVVAICALVLALVPVLMFWNKTNEHTGWFIFGLVASAIFSSRFFVQWVQSERRRQNHMGLAFWYISLVGGMMLLMYSLKIRDLPFIIGFAFTVIPYSRNIRLIYKQRARERGQVVTA